MNSNDFGFPTRAEKAIMMLIVGVLAVLVLGGCNGQRDQEIANSAETITKAVEAQEQGVPVEATAPAIKANANAIVKATGKTPVPAATTAAWVEDPVKASAAAGEQAKTTGSLGAGGWAGVIGIGIGLLGVLRFAAPFIPGVGGIWKTGIDALWNLAQHKRAKEADAAQARVADATALVLPVIRSFRETKPDLWAQLPEPVRSALEAIQKAG